MSNDVRYEIGEVIAQGDFATVFRGRDLRLDREVAIKQLHQQYLDNPQQTERYWQEAQILARLEHPHVMTIYDVVPERGWLILELMKGSLKDQLGERQINLQDLRLTILYASRALSFFQQHHILHGDVKPSNLLIDRNNVIKLGDFGIARRLQNDGGSAIKGTTRYIAPEVVSDKFGPVGPHSDIYSLGFSAYELLCGERFESMFPGLHMFGRDQQLAWIMWHSAPDRRLPRIKDVLEGVPEQLAAIIEKMTNKDPAQRYRSADQIIADLNRDDVASIGGPSPEEEEAMRRETQQARRKRYLAIGAFSISLLLCVAMLFPRRAEPPKPAPPKPTAGRVGKVDVDRNRIYLKSQDIVTVDENDLILLDGVVRKLSDLEPNDDLEIQYFDGPDGETKRIRATRGESKSYAGRMVSIDLAERKISLDADGGEHRQFSFDGETPITLNGDAAVVANLRTGDTIDVQYWTDENGAHAVALDALRQLQTSGVVESFDVASEELSFLKAGKPTTMRLDNGCAISINGRGDLAGRSISLGDLEAGDEIVSLIYDTVVRRIEVTRDLSDIAEVWSVDPAASQLTVLVNDERVVVGMGAAPIRYEDRSVDPSFLRKGDRLLVAHDSPDHRQVTAKSIEVTDLVRDPRAIALVISQQSYDSIQITPYEYAARDAELVVEALDTGARVPEEQIAQLQDLTRDQLVAAIGEFLAVQGQRSQLIVYFVGQAYVDLRTGGTYLAARDFRLEDMPGTGLRLRDLLAALEEFQSREKLLLLDTCHQVSAVESQSQPSTGDQIREEMIGEAVSRSVIVVGSCDTERLVIADEDREHGQFALQIAAALKGNADDDDDQHVSADELYRYLQKHLMEVQQTPVCFQPDTRPPRLTPEAADAIRDLLAEISRGRISPNLLEMFTQAEQLSGNEPDAQLAYALVNFKAGRTGESLDLFRAVLGAHPKAWVAYHAAIYQHLAKKEWGTAGELLARLLRQLATDSKTSNDYLAHLLRFAGISSGFLATVDADPQDIQNIDAAADRLSAEQQAVYNEGRNEFAARYQQTPVSQRGSARRFYKFDFDAVQQYLLDRLN
jgi:serine/threonine-protein kinase